MVFNKRAPIALMAGARRTTKAMEIITIREMAVGGVIGITINQISNSSSMTPKGRGLIPVKS